MRKKQILINAIMSVTQIFVIGITLFILYRFLLKTLGVEQLGIWALVLATTSITQIANFGLSGSVVKFVAKYIARDENKNVSEVIQTAVISVAGFAGFILIIGYPVIKWVLGLIVPGESIALAVSILPFTMLAFWIMVITGIFQSGLDGCQRIDLRSFLLMGGSLINLGLCYYLAPAFGLKGVAYAQVSQNAVILLASWIFLKRQLPELPTIPYKWNKMFFKEIVGYGINFQIISVAGMFCDPVTKALLSKFGGLSMVGYYEMASRMVQQLRSIVVSANQVLIPAIADLKEKIPEKINSVYLTSYQLIFYLAVPLFTLIILFAPLISKIWIGHYERYFIIFSILLTVGNFLNTIGVPAYFVYLGIGELRWNVISQITVSLLNVGLGYLLGLIFNGFGVVVAWIFSLALGSSLIYLSYHVRYKIPLTDLLPKASRGIMILCLVGISASFIMQGINGYYPTKIMQYYIIPVAFFILVLATLWFHPMRKRLQGWFGEGMLKKA